MATRRTTTRKRLFLGWLRRRLAVKLLLAMVVVATVPLALRYLYLDQFGQEQSLEADGRMLASLAEGGARGLELALQAELADVGTLAADATLLRELENRLASYTSSTAAVAAIRQRDVVWRGAIEAGEEPPRDGLSDASAGRLAVFQEFQSSPKQLSFYDRIGALVADTGSSDRYDVSADPAFKASLVGNRSIDIHPAPDGLAVVTWTPVAADGGLMLGALRSESMLGELETRVFAPVLGVGEQYLLVQRPAEVLFASPGRRLFSNPAAFLPSAEQESGGSWGMAEDESGGEVLVGAATVLLDVGGGTPLELDVFAAVDSAAFAVPLRERVSRAELGLWAVSLGGALLMALLLSHVLSRQPRQIAALLDKIARGDLKSRARVVSNDELGAVAVGVNQILDATAGLTQSGEERDRMQRSVMNLLEEVSGVAEGDLTREAQVTADITGSIADSFNYMISELRAIISQVQDATRGVTGASSQMRQGMVELAERSQQQAQLIVRSSEQLDNVAESLRNASLQTTASVGSAQSSVSTADRGYEAVGRSVAGMNRIRDQVQETSKRIKRLGETSQEVSEIVELIAEISDRTGLLALNASIQAAAAGEAGRGFAVLAEEVERLSERSSESAARIETLIGAFQSETSEAVNAMEATTQEVVHGSTLVAEAGTALESIRQATDDIAQVVQSVSGTLDRSTTTTEAVSQSIAGVSQATLEQSKASQSMAEQMGHLAELAAELQESVRRFRLPEDGRSSAGSMPEIAAG